MEGEWQPLVSSLWLDGHPVRIKRSKRNKAGVRMSYLDLLRGQALEVEPPTREAVTPYALNDINDKSTMKGLGHPFGRLCRNGVERWVF